MENHTDTRETRRGKCSDTSEFSYLQQQGPRRIRYEQEDKNNGAYGSRSHGGHRSDRDDTFRDGKLLDTPDRRRDRYKHYSISNLDKHYDHQRYHLYKRSDRGYFLDEFKKEKSPNFDGEMKKPQDVEECLLVMRNSFKLHDYSENMKTIVDTFNFKGKTDIWWEEV